MVNGAITTRQRPQLPGLVLVLATSLLGGTLLADDSAPVQRGYYTEDIELSAEDLRDMTSQILAENPMLASSPGVKAAGATRHLNKYEYDLDVASILFYPHIETAGIKQAYHVECLRQVPDTAWVCEEARIRRYLTLESQSFEVRITGTIESEAALALIAATRRALPLTLEDGAAAPQTATIILPRVNESGYLVVWGTPEGYGRLTMQARLSDGADPTDPNGWSAGVYRPDN